MDEQTNKTLHYKIDVISALRDVGWNSGKLRDENADAVLRGEKASGLSSDTMQRLRHGQPISWKNIETICKKLNCQPGDFLEYS